MLVSKKQVLFLKKPACAPVHSPVNSLFIVINVYWIKKTQNTLNHSGGHQ